MAGFVEDVRTVVLGTIPAALAIAAATSVQQTGRKQVKNWV